MYTYCVFCRTVRCRAVRLFLEATTPYRVLQARIVQRKWVKGEETREEHDYLPGYLFLYTEEPIGDIQILYRVDGVIRLLGMRDEEGNRHALLTGADEVFARKLYECGGVIDNMKVYREGDRLRPAEGLFKDMEGVILKVDRQRKRLLVEYTFDRVRRQVWMGYDVVEDAPKGSLAPL